MRRTTPRFLASKPLRGIPVRRREVVAGAVRFHYSYVLGQMAVQFGRMRHRPNQDDGSGSAFLNNSIFQRWRSSRTHTKAHEVMREPLQCQWTIVTHSFGMHSRLSEKQYSMGTWARQTTTALVLIYCSGDTSSYKPGGVFVHMSSACWMMNVEEWLFLLFIFNIAQT